MQVKSSSIKIDLPSRRIFLGSFVAASIGLVDSTNFKADARGLIIFPCSNYEFLNKYHFMRAGESLLEEEGIWSTNPLFLTNREAALSERGIEQVTELCKKMKADRVAPTVVRYSLAANVIDSANIVGKELKIGRDRLVPEFNFMDPRAIGAWDMSSFNMTKNAIIALDHDEGNSDGTGSSPPENDDGTPNESLADQVVRLQQLLSVLETQYSGDTILLIFPDGVGPALLTCLIGGVPLNRVHELEYEPGEIRLDINYDSCRRYLEREPSEDYLNALDIGRNQLISLRKDPNQRLNVKDLKYEEDLRIEEKRKAEKQEEEMKNNKMRKEKEYRENRSLDQNLGSKTILDPQVLAIAGATILSGVGTMYLFSADNQTQIVQRSQMNVTGYSLDSSFQTTLIESTEEPLNQQALLDSPDNVLKETSESKQKRIGWDPDEDDGGLAWLGTLEDIIQSDESSPVDDEKTMESTWE